MFNGNAKVPNPFVNTVNTEYVQNNRKSSEIS